ncbi:minor capsid protein [Myxococcus sp. 1LA]
MTPRDVELDLATFLEAAGLDLSTSTNPPTLYPGPFPDSAPSRMVCLRHTGGESGLYLGTGSGVVAADVQVIVRGPKKSYTDTRAVAVRCWSALHLARIPGFVEVRCEGAGPTFMGPDGEDRPRFVFNLTARYAA